VSDAMHAVFANRDALAAEVQRLRAALAAATAAAQRSSHRAAELESICESQSNRIAELEQRTEAHDLRAALAAATQQADADRATLMQQRDRWKDEAYAAAARIAELEAKLAAVPHNAFLRMSYGAQTPEDEHVAQMWIASIDWQAVQP